jgi:hypothetical protein
MYTCVCEDLLEIVMKIGQHRYNEVGPLLGLLPRRVCCSSPLPSVPQDAKVLTAAIIDEFGGNTAALAKLVRNAYTLVPSNLSEASAPLIKTMFDARFKEGQGSQSLSEMKKITCGFPWIPTGTGTKKRGTYGDEFWAPEGIW